MPNDVRPREVSRASLATLSRAMAWLSTIGFVLQPVIVVYIFIDPTHSRWMMFNIDHLGAALTAQVPLAGRILAMAGALAVTGFTMWALWSLRRLFLLYARGRVFSRDALSALNHVAVALFASVIVGFVMQVPISLALTWYRGSGHRQMSLGFGSDDVATLFMAGAVLVIARVMAEARRVADENESFV